jgi:hypothetical protein
MRITIKVRYFAAIPDRGLADLGPASWSPNAKIIPARLGREPSALFSVEAATRTMQFDRGGEGAVAQGKFERTGAISHHSDAQPWPEK